MPVTREELAAASRAIEEAIAHRDYLIATATSEGMPQRDIVTEVNLSRERVRQIARAGGADNPTRPAGERGRAGE